MNTKSLLITLLAAALVGMTIPASAGGYYSSGDAILGGAIGGGAGAAVGSAVGGRDGAILGSALGAATGVVLISSPRPVVVHEYWEERPVYFREHRDHGWHHGHFKHRHHGDRDWDDD